tara:strand:+ start:170 stop:418 length:249 start_codon:yes stop_codon:yes gene_type:complete
VDFLKESFLMFFNKKVFFVLLSFLCFLGEVKSSEIKEGATFYFVRHGITDWSMDHLLNGPQDLPLNEGGKAHIQDQGDIFFH